MYITKKTPFALAAMLAFSGSAMAIEFAVEGKLTAVETEMRPDPLDASRNIEVPTAVMCAGSRILLGANTAYTSPSGAISATQLIDKTRFPGKLSTALSPPEKSAFLDGTCIIEGDEAPATGRLAAAVFVEVAENVLVGATTPVPSTAKATPAGEIPTFAILGVPVVLLNTKNEPGGRIIAGPPTNAVGAVIDLATVLPGDLSSAEGYLGDDGNFYAFAVETTGGRSATPVSTSSGTLQRADATYVSNTAIKLEIRGGCIFYPERADLPAGTAARTLRLSLAVDRGTDPNTGKPVWINPTDARPMSSIVSNVSCVEDVTTGQGTYRYRQDRYTNFGTLLPKSAQVTVTMPAPSTGNPVPPLPEGPQILLNRIKFP